MPTDQADDPISGFDQVVSLVAPAPPRARVDVAVIGGGIIGTSIAYHLAEAGVRDVLVIERDSLGSGSSAKPLGGVRATFSDANNVLLGQRSLAAFEAFEARFGTAIGLRQVGYLFLCRTEAELAAVEASVRLQNTLGCASSMISSAQAYALNPFLQPSSLLGASFSPRDGYAEPARVVAGYAAAARRLGVTFAEHTEVLQVATTVDGGYVIGTGAWSTRIGAMLGVHLPVEGVRRQIGFTAQQAPPPPTVPFTLDLSTTLYFHNYRNGLLLGISNPDEEVGLCR